MQENKEMIISASYKTDIPTFYGQWFINRLRAGYCKVVNPYNQRISVVDLTQGQVDGFVFWTKNLIPFFKHLAEVQERGFPFVVQYCINGYPRAVEFSVVDVSKSIESMKRLSEIYGSKVAVWRYDTILFSSITSIDFHRRNFEKLARALHGTADEVVISFAQLYKKTLKNVQAASKEFGFSLESIEDEEKRDLTIEFSQIAKSCGFKLTMCSQKHLLVPGVASARCIDAERLAEISGKKVFVQKKGNRPDCGCFFSRDIGEYDTCPHGCIYCYAVQNREVAKNRYKQHDPESEFLFTPKDYLSNKVQGSLFG